MDERGGGDARFAGARHHRGYLYVVRVEGGLDGRVVEERQPPPGNQRRNETAAVCEIEPSIIAGRWSSVLSNDGK